VVLLTADRFSTAAIMRRTGLSKPSAWRWREHYLGAVVDGLLRDRTRPARIPALSPKSRAQGAGRIKAGQHHRAVPFAEAQGHDF
jgi:hypothetical protein